MTSGRRFGLTALFLALALFVGTRTLYAQGSYASIHGTVTDTSGAVVAGAHVTVTNGSTGISATATTDGKGYYVLPQLAVGGPYSIRIDMSGFKSFQALGLQLTLNENYDQDAQLQAGSVSQTVEVNANSLQVETSDTQVSSTFDASQLETLPMLSRNASIVQKLTTGTVESSDRFGTYSVNGSQTQENSYLLDGADINDLPLQTQGFIINPDALGEITVLNSTQNPEYSRNSGAIINEQMKTGTNQFHGDGFEFYRDTFMNLGGYFAQPGARPVFHQNEYGGTLGGPVLKNKLFFFMAYQGFHSATGAVEDPFTPTDAQLGRISGDNYADLTDDQNNLTDTGSQKSLSPQTLSGNTIPFAVMGPQGACGPGSAKTTWADCFPSGDVELPTSSFNAISSRLIQQYFPSPNVTTAGLGQYFWNAPTTEKEDQGIIRIDAKVTSKDLIWASNLFESEPDLEGTCFTCGTLPGFAQNDARHFKFFDASWTHTFSPTLLNELRAGYYRFDYAAVEPAQVVQPSSLGFAITPQDPGSAGVPNVSITGYSSIGFSVNGPQPRLDTNTSFSDNLTKIVGNHTFQFGAHWEGFLVSNPFFAKNSGSYGFGGTGQYSSGDPLLDFLVGIPDNYNQGSGAQIIAKASEIFSYFQDSWKVSNSFTFNYGLAWDSQNPFQNLQYGGEAVFCFIPGEQSKIFPTQVPGLVYPGDPGCTNRGGTTAKYDHFAPRFGFDWSPEGGLGFLTGPTGQHSLAIRGGFGVYYNRDSEEAQLQNLEDPPFGGQTTGYTGDPSVKYTSTPSFANPFQDVNSAPPAGAKTSINNPFPYSFPTPGDTNINFQALGDVPYAYISTINPNYDTPYAYNYNLNIQRQLPGNQVIQVAYVGSIGRKLVRAYEANKITAAGHAAAIALCKSEGGAIGSTDPNQSCFGAQAYLNELEPQDFTDTTGNIWSVGQVYTDGNSNYNSLQVSLQKATGHGLLYNIGYTWSHALDNGSGLESTGFGTDLMGVNWTPGYSQLSYGNSDFDARNRLFAEYEYVVPLTTGMRQNYIVNEAMGGWHVAGYTVLQSGFPANIGEGVDNRSLYCESEYWWYYECADTPQTSSFNIKRYNPRASATHQYFDTTPFSFEPLGTFGNVTRNFFHGPGFNYTDMSLYKDFPIGGSDSPRYVEVRMDGANVFNHPNFAEPDGGIYDPTFGQVEAVRSAVNTDPAPGRQVQIAGKIYF